MTEILKRKMRTDQKDRSNAKLKTSDKTRKYKHKKEEYKEETKNS